MGKAFLNRDGSLGLGLTIVSDPSAAPVPRRGGDPPASIALAALQAIAARSRRIGEAHEERQREQEDLKNRLDRLERLAAHRLQ